MTNRDELVEAVRGYLYWDRLARDPDQAMQRAEAQVQRLFALYGSEEHEQVDIMLDAMEADELRWLLIYMVGKAVAVIQSGAITVDEEKLRQPTAQEAERLIEEWKQ